jgi:hypothetical protein
MIAKNRGWSVGLLKEGPNPSFQKLRSAGFTLPHSQDIPPTNLQRSMRCRVAYLIAFQLRSPIRKIAKRFVGELAARQAMLMPKATMNENDFAAAAKYQVRFSRKQPAMKPVAKAHPMNHPPDDHFGGGVNAANRLHCSAADNGVYSVHYPTYLSGYKL